jgi:large subunit ribosomal protein L25
MIELGIEGEPKRTVMIGELERDAITRGFLHVGFHHVSSTERVHTQVPVRLTGEPDSVRTKQAMLEQLVETVEIKALPGDVPAHIDIDVSNLQIGDKLHISDLPHDSKIEFLSPEETAIASLHLVYGASGDATDAAEAAPAEPAAG